MSGVVDSSRTDTLNKRPTKRTATSILAEAFAVTVVTLVYGTDGRRDFDAQAQHYESF